MPVVQLAVPVDGPADGPVLVLANPIGTSVGIWRRGPGPVTGALLRHFLRAQQ